MTEVQKHDDEEEEHHDGAGVYDDLDRSQEMCLQKHEDPGGAGEASNHEQQARDRASPNHHAQSSTHSHRGEDEK